MRPLGLGMRLAAGSDAPGSCGHRAAGGAEGARAATSTRPGRTRRSTAGTGASTDLGAAALALLPSPWFMAPAHCAGSDTFCPLTCIAT